MPVSSVYILKFDVDGGNSEPWGFIDGDVAVYFFFNKHRGGIIGSFTECCDSYNDQRFYWRLYNSFSYDSV